MKSKTLMIGTSLKSAGGISRVEKKYHQEFGLSR
jgi:hypothetical protein